MSKPPTRQPQRDELLLLMHHCVSLRNGLDVFMEKNPGQIISKGMLTGYEQIGELMDAMGESLGFTITCDLCNGHAITLPTP